MALRNFQYNKIIREYDSRQLKNRHNLEKRTKEVYEQIPRIESINQEIASNAVKNAKLLLSGQSDSLHDLAKSNEALSAERRELLLKHGFSEDYLSLRYHCSDCKDTGYIENKKCHCFKQAIVDQIYSQSNRKEILVYENFSTFDYHYYTDGYVDDTTHSTPLQNIKKITGLSHQFVNQFDKGYQNLLIYGNTGVGKTFLTNCIARELMDLSHTVIYLTSFQLFDILEKYKFNKGSEEETEEQFSYILNCDLLIIDDLGTELNNAFITSQLYLCINERHLRQKSTIISTNLSWEDLKNNYSERIFSRITSNYTFLKIIGEDIRLKKTFSS